MATWSIQPCSVSDAPALAENNMSAFWTDRTWRLNWGPEITLPYLITQCAERLPRNLLRNRAALRHEKAVDPSTGELVGYARWEMPISWAGKGEGEWQEAMTADVGKEEREKYEEMAKKAWWEPRDMPGLDNENIRIKNRILAEKDYINLDYLAVHPMNKGKGVATALVKSGIEKAEKLGVDIFILAFEAGRGVYTRLGFKEVARNVEDDSRYGGVGEYAAYFMVYEVRRDKA
ncbi:hypothetical protein BT69DRAFT_1345889 [Atractiella rhizophila]|nr:hypothetical protein BT69DRAFT_1345889 [Atractiella rhizophila]